MRAAAPVEDLAGDDRVLAALGPHVARAVAEQFADEDELVHALHAAGRRLQDRLDRDRGWFVIRPLRPDK